MQVERADPDVGGGRDVGHLGVVEPFLREDPDRGGQEIAPRPLAPPLAAQAVVGMATQVLSWWTEQESLSIDTLQETMIGLALRGLGVHAPDAGAPRGGPSHG